MYTYLIEKIGAKWANVLMGMWYFGLLCLVITLFGFEAGLFRYLNW